MKKAILLLAIITLVFTSCSSDDSNDNSLNSLNQTEWEFAPNGTGYYSIYFSTIGNTATITNSHHIPGTYSYDNPTVVMDYSDNCNDPAYIFSTCIVTGIIDGNNLIIQDNGEEYIFNRINE